MRIGIIGTGGVARRHLGVLCQMEDVEVVGHVSADHARAAVQAAAVALEVEQAARVVAEHAPHVALGDAVVDQQVRHPPEHLRRQR